MKYPFLASVAKGSILNSPARLEELARSSRWLIRRPRKLSPIQFVHGLLHAVSLGDCSFRLLATSIGLRFGTKSDHFDTISKPALWERVNRPAVRFLKAILAELIKGECALGKAPIPALPMIKRIIVEDSTILNLDRQLLDQFPATSNQNGDGAGLRLQLAVDLLSGEALRADLTDYNRNDQSASSDIIPDLNEGDLLIRDLGYYVNDPFNKIVEKGGHYLSRHLGARALHSLKKDGGGKINLLRHLQKNASQPGDVIDIDVVMGGGQKGAARVKCRLVARRVPPEVQAKKLRRIKQDEKRQRRIRSKVHKKLQGWDIYITSLPREEVSPEKLFELYPLRWRVEIIFKACKGYTPMKAIAAHRSNGHHVQALIYAWLCLLVTATKSGAFALAKPVNGILQPNYLSLLKVVPKVIGLLTRALELSCGPMGEFLDRMNVQIAYHDRYEQRAKRTDMAALAGRALGLTASTIPSGCLQYAA